VGIHHFPFKTKVKHLLRHKFVEQPRTRGEIDEWVCQRCSSCHSVGLMFYIFKGRGWKILHYWSETTKTRYYLSRQASTIYRRFVLCGGCGLWKEV
jgi:hypothetical protein